MDAFLFDIEDSLVESNEEDLTDYGFSIDEPETTNGFEEDESNWSYENEGGELPMDQTIENDMATSSDFLNENITSEEETMQPLQKQVHSYRPISFTGVGQCSCGCGSFGGNGSLCSYCQHPWSAHSRYKA